MKRLLVLSAVAGALIAAAPAAARTSYCSPTGDYCTSVARLKGIRYLRFSTFSVRGLVRICVRDPTAARVCHSFRLRKAGPAYQVKVLWKRRYPNRGTGTYRVTFFIGPTRLGPVLSFTQRP
jgi:hypothetical protein